jgi:hypothetical protein
MAAPDTTAGILKYENSVYFNAVNYVSTNRKNFCGIYGVEDGLFTPIERNLVQSALHRPGEPNRFVLIQGASHALYLDKQPQFIQALKTACEL